MCLNFEGHLCKRGLSIEGTYCTMPAHDVSFANRPYTGFVGRAVFSGRMSGFVWFCYCILSMDWMICLWHSTQIILLLIQFGLRSPTAALWKFKRGLWCICFNANQRRHRASQYCLILFLFGCKCAFCEAKKAKQWLASICDLNGLHSMSCVCPWEWSEGVWLVYACAGVGVSTAGVCVHVIWARVTWNCACGSVW